MYVVKLNAVAGTTHTRCLLDAHGRDSGAGSGSVYFVTWSTTYLWSPKTLCFGAISALSLLGAGKARENCPATHSTLN